MQPIRIHPQTPKLFEFRGKPLVFITATEHYGAVMNRPFRFERYLADAAKRHMTLTRLFMLYRELQATVNPYSTCKPESPDYVAPFLRTGPGLALDAQPKYDLTKWNPEFFERLHRFLSLASEYGIIVEVTLLSNVYGASIWALHPLHSENNINGLEPALWPEFLAARHPNLLKWQLTHVRKIVEETRRYDNVIYEVCNEPGGNVPGTDNPPSQDEVDQWQVGVARAIRQADPHHHLISAQEAFDYHGFAQSCLKSFRELPIDIVNLHPLPNIRFGERRYDMGEFMRKQLCLRPLRDFCLDTYAERKPLNFDEDNSSTQYKDFDAWTIHRKRAWTTLMSGGHYDCIDFSIINYCETGTPASRRCLRSWMRYLSDFIHGIDLVRARPLRDWPKAQPAHTLASVLAVEGQDYRIYLADARELGEGVGQPIEGELVVDLPAGSFLAACYCPVSGGWSPAVAIQDGSSVRLSLPTFQHDLAIRIWR